MFTFIVLLAAVINGLGVVHISCHRPLPRTVHSGLYRSE